MRRGGGQKVLPDGWVRDAGSSKQIGGRTVNYCYMIWPIDAPGTVNAGAFEAVGIFAQYLYVSPKERVVIVMWGAQPKPTDREPVAHDDFFAAVSEALP